MLFKKWSTWTFLGEFVNNFQFFFEDFWRFWRKTIWRIIFDEGQFDKIFEIHTEIFHRIVLFAINICWILLFVKFFSPNCTFRRIYLFKLYFSSNCLSSKCPETKSNAGKSAKLIVDPSRFPSFLLIFESCADFSLFLIFASLTILG